MGVKTQDNEKNQDKLKPGKNRALAFYFAGVSVFMFLLGLMLGRGSSPLVFDIPDIEAKIKSYLAEAEPSEEPDYPDFVFFEVLKQSEGFTNEAGGHKKPRSSRITIYNPPFESELVEGKKEEIKPERYEKPEEKAEKKIVQAAEVLRKSITVSEKKSVDSSEKEKEEKPYTIQVAAMHKAEDARLLLGRLKSQGYDAYIFEGSDPSGQLWHRVRIGHFSDRKAAEVLLKKLELESFKGFILKK